MYSCNSTGQDRYCCNDDCSCSENGQNQVVSFSGEPYTVTVIGQTGTYPNPSATPSSSSKSDTKSASNSATTSDTAAATSTGAAPNSSSDTNSTSSSSNAAVIGGGVGGAVGGVAILGAIGAFFYIRRRKRRAQPGQAQFSNEKGQAPPSYGYDSAYDLDRTGPPEGQPWNQGGPGMPPSQVSELATDSHLQVSELPGDQQAAELPASER